MKYTNNTDQNVTIAYDKTNSPCFYQNPDGLPGIPDSVTLSSNSSTPFYRGESREPAFTYCGTIGTPAFVLDFTYNNNTQSCRFKQDFYKNIYNPSSSECPAASILSLSVNQSTDPQSYLNRGEIVIGLKQNAHMNLHSYPHASSMPHMNHPHMAPPHPLHEIEHYNTSRVNPMRNMAPPHHSLPTPHLNQRPVVTPHAGHEIEHYNTSKVNPMTRGHQIINHKPMIEKR